MAVDVKSIVKSHRSFFSASIHFKSNRFFARNNENRENELNKEKVSQDSTRENDSSMFHTDHKKAMYIVLEEA